jgi:ParB-like chromosome segregation protein Spo0J
MKKDMIIEKIEISKLKPAKYNPRQITKKQYNDLKDSLDKFSLVEPIVVNKDMTIIGGHQRFKIWKENTEQTNVEDITIPCVVLDLNKEQERELNIRLNKNTGDWDFDILGNEFEIQELKEWGFKEIELGLNIDKINEDKEDIAIITIKEDDLIKAQELYNDLKEKGYNVKIK